MTERDTQQARAGALNLHGLLAPLTEGLTIHLGFDVQEIAVAANAVRLTSADGRVEFGSHVIVTVPLGVLKEDSPRFIRSMSNRSLGSRSGRTS